MKTKNTSRVGSSLAHTGSQHSGGKRIVGNILWVFIAYCLLPAAYFFAVSLLTVLTAQSQSTVEFHSQVVGLGNPNDNVINNNTYLEEFFESLYQLKTKNDRKISIIHIGDSHIQGDYLTQPVRKNFQQHFGNAGRGLVVPARVAGTNESFNIYTSSADTWRSKRCINPEDSLPIGIGGITIHTEKPNAALDIFMNDLWMDYSFTKLALFHLEDSASFSFAIRDTARTLLASPESFTKTGNDNYSPVTLPRSVSAIQLETIRRNEWQRHATIFGINLENGNNGILYHSIGVNGAKFKHFAAATFFARQTELLNPKLFIISLGTNEVLDYPYLDRNFYQRIDDLISGLRHVNPNAKFILSTPALFPVKPSIPVSAIVKIREQIIRYAVDNGFAFWDLYKALGGENAISRWKACGWIRSDGIHYTRDAYEYQGNLLFEAIMKSYNQHVQLRHP